jgi:hypothetical protein
LRRTWTALPWTGRAKPHWRLQRPDAFAGTAATRICVIVICIVLLVRSHPWPGCYDGEPLTENQQMTALAQPAISSTGFGRHAVSLGREAVKVYGGCARARPTARACRVGAWRCTQSPVCFPASRPRAPRPGRGCRGHLAACC